MFLSKCLIFGCLAAHVLAEGVETVSELAARLENLEHKVHGLEKQVSNQQEQIDSQKELLEVKTKEIHMLRSVLVNNAKYLTRDDVNKRFLTKDEVAFFARLDKVVLTGIAQSQGILYDNVVLNSGGGYNANTGVFTAPVDGFYLFSVAVTSNNGHSHELQVALKKNNAILARAHAHGDSGHLDQGGITIVEQLKAGDTISVQSMSQDSVDLHGEGLSSFSGFQIVFT